MIETISETVPHFTAEYLEQNYAPQNHVGNSATFVGKDEGPLDPEHEHWEIIEVYKANKCQYALFSIMDPESYLYDSSQWDDEEPMAADGNSGSQKENNSEEKEEFASNHNQEDL